FFTNYAVTIKGTAKDTSGATLDGDYDGKSEGSPEDDYVFNFKTRKPDVAFEMIPLLPHEIKSCNEPDSFYVTDFASGKLKNKEKMRKLVVKFSGVGSGDSSFSFLVDSLILPADTTITDTILKMTYRYSYHVDVTAKFYAPGDTTVLFEGKSPVDGVVVYKKPVCCPPSPDCDSPDDNGSVSNSNYPTPWYIDTESKIGILNNGSPAGMGHLLGRFKIPTALVNTELRILGTYNTIDSLKVLIIPSGGLYGLENNSLFKQKIQGFINNGGTVLCMAQQRGYEFSSFFEGVSGYGWQEDYSCQSSSAYLSEWHTVLSGQTNLISNIPVDGFFINEPQNSQVLMRRRTSGMSELIIYPEGSGNVIITGSYVDWGYGVGQWSYDAVNLIRDIITWAMDTKRPILEYYSGNSMSLNIPVYYYPGGDTIPANKVKIKILKPNRDSLHTQEILLAQPLYPGDSTVINLGFTAPSMLGIYPVNYALYNDTLLLQKEKLGERFAVKVDIPVGNYNLGDFCMWTVSSKDRIMEGDTVDFTIFIRNNTNDSLKSKIVFTSHFGPGFYTLDSLKGLILPPDTIISINYSYAPFLSGRLMTDLYPDTNLVHPPLLARSLSTYIWVTYPTIDLVVKTDTTDYFYNDTVFYKIKGIANFSGEYPLETTILDAKNNIYFMDIDTVDIDTTGYFEVQKNYPVSDTITSGVYRIRARVFARGKTYERWTYFQIRYPRLTVEVLKDTLIMNEDTVRFVTHIEPDFVKIRNLRVFFNITHTQSGNIYKDSLYCDSIANLDTILFSFSIPAEMRKKGTYTFNYRFLYLDRNISGRYTLNNFIQEVPSFDKYWYIVRDTVRYHLKITNGHHFLNSGYLVSF
ncbi:MAG: hypothetical protein ACPL28_12110, partial [bacterium]